MSLTELINYEFFNKEVLSEIYKEIYGKSHYRNPLPEGSNYNYRKFIIVATQRTGSTFLMNILRSHSKIVCYDEIFMHNIKPVWGFKRIDENTHRMSVRHPVEYLEKIYFRNYSDNVKSVGFKLMYDQISHSNVKKILSTFGENDLIIHLKRKNKLRTYLSLKKADSTSVYHVLASYVPEVIKGNPVSINKDPIYISRNEFMKFVTRVNRNEHLYNKLIYNNNHIDMYYEDLESNHFGQVANVIERLGLQHEELISINQKMNDKPLSYALSNYNELKNEFKNTDYSCYFDE